MSASDEQRSMFPELPGGPLEAALRRAAAAGREMRTEPVPQQSDNDVQLSLFAVPVDQALTLADQALAGSPDAPLWETLLLLRDSVRQERQS